MKTKLAVWFIPPVVVPAFLAAMIVAFALYRAYG